VCVYIYIYIYIKRVVKRRPPPGGEVVVRRAARGTICGDDKVLTNNAADTVSPKRRLPVRVYLLVPRAPEPTRTADRMCPRDSSIVLALGSPIASYRWLDLRTLYALLLYVVSDLR